MYYIEIIDGEKVVREYGTGDTVVTTTSKEDAHSLSAFEILQKQKIQELHNKYQAEYDAYLAQYPKREIESFPTKQAEAVAWRIDNTSPTPTIDAMVNNDTDARLALLQGVLAKIDYLAQQEGIMLAKRDAIKACTTLEELEAIEI
jgi:hypothetical protein